VLGEPDAADGEADKEKGEASDWHERKKKWVMECQ
jgi:hypothetical protein